MKFSYYIICLGALFFTSCSKELKVGDAPDFNVNAESSVYKVGEEVIFNITGTADNISFYSGNTYNDYDFKDGRVADLGDAGVTMAFTSSVQLGTQTDQFSILVSNNLNESYGSLDVIKAATWTDITDRFVLGNSATFLPSTEQDISDLVEEGKPIYIAFKYVTHPQVENGFVRTWMIQNFNLTSTALYDGEKLSIADQMMSGFRIIDEDPENTPARSLVTGTRVTLRGNIYKDPADPIYDPENPIYDPENPIYNKDSVQYNPNAVLPTFEPYDHDSPYNDPLRENWAISAPIYINKVDLGPDLSIPIKGLRSSLLSTYKYIYDKPGTYKVRFVASNNSIDDVRQVVRELTITIQE